MSFPSSVLKTNARHRRWLRKANNGFRAHQAKLARIRAREEEEEWDLTAEFPTVEMFGDYMRNKLGCC
jgi:hypothetical protein